ncbi:MAG: type II toxin-antitoxin system RelB/DinJ family antitoxin [Olsenella sp.]|jgi:antitoxin component of RelBE/YafQ-DinJ toxin-antitoxin module|nr:type II toxin-antitoxin system RelB/DinJ family antitoxin [Olsenella sp.]
MATTVVSGRIDVLTARRVERILAREGVAPGEVIRRTWEAISETGKIPADDAKMHDEASSKLREFMELRESLPKVDWLDTLTDSQAKDMVASRYE